MQRRWCIVPGCRNNTKSTPEKLFVYVPVKPKMRKMWLKAARRDTDGIAATSCIYICEDHFDIEKDMANYGQYKMGFSKKILISDGVVPSRFHWLKDQNKRLGDDDIFLPEPVTPIEEVQPVEINRKPEIYTIGSIERKARWESFRCQYRKYIRKFSSSSDLSGSLQKKFKYARVMEFLRPQIRSKSASNSVFGDDKPIEPDMGSVVDRQFSGTANLRSTTASPIPCRGPNIFVNSSAVPTEKSILVKSEKILESEDDYIDHFFASVKASFRKFSKMDQIYT